LREALSSVRVWRFVFRNYFFSRSWLATAAVYSGSAWVL